MTRISLQADVRGSPRDLDVLLGALTPEGTDEFPGVHLALDRAGPERVHLVLEGERAPPVRAAVNAVLGWMRTIEDVLDVTTTPPEET